MPMYYDTSERNATKRKSVINVGGQGSFVFFLGAAPDFKPFLRGCVNILCYQPLVNYLKHFFIFKILLLK